MVKELPEPIEDLLQSRDTNPVDLLEQLRKLEKLWEEGQLTAIEYEQLRKRLNG